MDHDAIFASSSVTVHLARGAAAVAALATARYLFARTPPMIGVPLGMVLLAATLWLLRGCPMCWTIGLIETVRNRAAATMEKGR